MAEQVEPPSPYILGAITRHAAKLEAEAARLAKNVPRRDSMGPTVPIPTPPPVAASRDEEMTSPPGSPFPLEDEEMPDAPPGLPEPQSEDLSDLSDLDEDLEPDRHPQSDRHSEPDDTPTVQVDGAGDDESDPDDNLDNKSDGPSDDDFDPDDIPDNKVDDPSGIDDDADADFEPGTVRSRPN